MVSVLAAVTTLMAAQHPGTGCQQRMNAVCQGWNTDQSKCLACVERNIAKLEPNCTLVQAKKKCTNPPPGPSPAPPEPPLPPWTPIPVKPGALRPHILLWVVDDQGWANIGFHNDEHVLTPTMDKLAGEGIKLDRQYTYRWCAPTRSALLSGR